MWARIFKINRKWNSYISKQTNKKKVTTACSVIKQVKSTVLGFSVINTSTVGTSHNFYNDTLLKIYVIRKS